MKVEIRHVQSHQRYSSAVMAEDPFAAILEVISTLPKPFEPNDYEIWCDLAFRANMDLWALGDKNVFLTPLENEARSDPFRESFRDIPIEVWDDETDEQRAETDAKIDELVEAIRLRSQSSES